MPTVDLPAELMTYLAQLSRRFAGMADAEAIRRDLEYSVSDIVQLYKGPAPAMRKRHVAL